VPEVIISKVGLLFANRLGIEKIFAFVSQMFSSTQGMILHVAGTRLVLYVRSELCVCDDSKLEFRINTVSFGKV